MKAPSKKTTQKSSKTETKSKKRVRTKKVKNPQPKHLIVDEEFRSDKKKMSAFHNRLEKGELKWGYYATLDEKGAHYYVILIPDKDGN